MPRSAEILAGYCESDEYGRRKPESLSVSKMWAHPGGREDCPCADQHSAGAVGHRREVYPKRTLAALPI